MIILPLRQRARLVANRSCMGRPGHDPAPVVKLLSPVGPGTWLAAEMCGDGDRLFRLAGLSFGSAELGYFSLSELVTVRLPFGLRIERDRGFSTSAPLSRWAEEARRIGSIIAAEQRLARAEAMPDPDFSP